MMRLKAPADHPGVDVTAQAQLQPQTFPGVPDDLPLDPVADVYHVADAVGPPPPQEHQQLLVGAARLGLGEVQRDAQARGEPPRGLERRLQDLNSAPRRVPAQVDAHDAAALEGPGQLHDLQGLLRRVAPVDREDEVGVEGGTFSFPRVRIRGGPGLGLERADDVEDGGDVTCLGEVGLW